MPLGKTPIRVPEGLKEFLDEDALAAYKKQVEFGNMEYAQAINQVGGPTSSFGINPNNVHFVHKEGLEDATHSVMGVYSPPGKPGGNDSVNRQMKDSFGLDLRAAGEKTGAIAILGAARGSDLTIAHEERHRAAQDILGILDDLGVDSRLGNSGAWDYSLARFANNLNRRPELWNHMMDMWTLKKYKGNPMGVSFQGREADPIELALASGAIIKSGKIDDESRKKVLDAVEGYAGDFASFEAAVKTLEFFMSEGGDINDKKYQKYFKTNRKELLKQGLSRLERHRNAINAK
jgi:hypothetical protein